MIFKPRIFISSTFRENEKLRSDLGDFFESVGAEPMLYEYNLTPSVLPSTYRKDVAEADFVILIIKDNYGTKTERGISGIHEELKIALDLNLPLHVYHSKGSEVMSEPEFEIKEFKDLIHSNRISYYIFNGDSDLLERIKETTFEISNEIVMRKLSKMALDRGTVEKIKANYDYLQAVGMIKVIEYLKKVSTQISPIDTDLFDALKYLFDWAEVNDWVFIDKDLKENCKAMEVQLSAFFHTHGNDYTTKDFVIRTIRIPGYGNQDVAVHPLIQIQFPRKQKSEYVALINKFFKIFEKFKKRAGEIKLSADTFPEER